MIARPKISRNERKPAELGAFEVGHVALLSRPGADALIQQHPRPHRLKVFSQLEGKNLGVVFPDADLDAAADQIVLGALSYNGQRCTAIKLVYVHASVAGAFLDKFKAKVAAKKVGLLRTQRNISERDLQFISTH